MTKSSQARQPGRQPEKGQHWVRTRSPKPAHISTSGIAVIGLACRYPGASSVRELWENILGRRIEFRRMVDQRLPLRDYYDPDMDAPEKTYTTLAALMDGFVFDWQGLRIPRKTFESTDIVHWLALDTALKALADAGYAPGNIPTDKTGVIVGNTLTGEQTRSQTLRLRWPFVRRVLDITLRQSGFGSDTRNRLALEMEKLFKSAFYPVTEDSLAGGLSNTIAGRICNYLNFKGGGYVVDGACSSSLLSVATAASALKMGELDIALAGGVDVSLDPFELVGFAKAGALAKDLMHVYDRRASGFLPGEGCGFVVLKRLEDALRDDDSIYAVISGWGMSSDGKGGIMEPSSAGQARAISRAYSAANYHISDVDFVEGHGTGTKKGDRVELQGIVDAISQQRSPRATLRCGVTSFKSIVGHTKAAAGIGGFIKAVLAVNQRVIPPTANCEHPSDVFGKSGGILYPVIQGKCLPKDRVMRAGVSSAGFGGINCHVTIRSNGKPTGCLSPALSERALLASHQSSELFVFSARTFRHVQIAIRRFADELRGISFAELLDLAWLLARRVRHDQPVKVAVVTDSPQHLYEALLALDGALQNEKMREGSVKSISTGIRGTQVLLGYKTKEPRIGFLYPGQGSQRVGMTQKLVDRFEWANEVVGWSKDVAAYYRARDESCSSGSAGDEEDRFSDTTHAQPMIAASSLIWTRYLEKLGIKPAVVGGHSLGELTAFCAAGALSGKDLIKFAGLRGRLMAKVSTEVKGGMVGLNCPLDRAASLVGKIGGTLVIANINSPRQIVVSGDAEDIGRIIRVADREGIAARALQVSGAFHSPLMLKVSKGLQRAPLLQRSFEPNGEVRLYSCTNGLEVQSRIQLHQHFANQVLSQVNFSRLVNSMLSACDVLLEVGPGRVLTDLVASITGEHRSVCFAVEPAPNDAESFNTTLAALFVRSAPLQWEEFYRQRLTRSFTLPSRKQFIQNQCERLPDHGSQSQGVLAAIDSEIPVERGRVESAKLNGKGQQPLVARVGADKVGPLLIDLVQKITGFEEAAITYEMKLSDDLNLDSIKAAEVIAQAAAALGVAGKVDPTSLSNESLGRVRDRLQDLAGEALLRGAHAEESQSLLEQYTRRAWVNDFSVKWVRDNEFRSTDSDRRVFRHVAVLYDGGNEDILDEIRKRLAKDGICVSGRNIWDLEKGAVGNGSDADGIIVLLPREPDTGDVTKPVLERAVARMRLALDFCLRGGRVEDRAVAFVQYGGGSLADIDGPPSMESCCAKALGSTLHLEHADIRVRIVDFDATCPAAEIAKHTLLELCTSVGYAVVGYDRKLERRVPVYERISSRAYRQRGGVWGEKDVILVTGGAKGITAECALELARMTRAQLILVGRSGIGAQADGHRDEVSNTLGRFAREKLSCEYYQCDITDPLAVKELVVGVREKHGAITGFLHGAGLNSVRKLTQGGIDDICQEALPKIVGACNVLRALEDSPPALVIGLTSVIGVTGMAGSGWYGFANEMLNVILGEYRRRHEGTDVQTIAFSAWDEIGMAAKLGSLPRLREGGITPIPVTEGVKAFRRLVEYDPTAQQVIVAGRLTGLGTWLARKRPAREWRFIEHVDYFLPGVELVARAVLAIEDDPYLVDHNWKGSLLFPFVFGLEAMSQAVASVTQQPDLHRLNVADINLERPISVDKDRGTTLGVYAQVLPTEPGSDGPVRVRVELSSERTNYQVVHFSAIFEVGEALPGQPLPQRAKLAKQHNVDIDPKVDIYGSVLFQGEQFQRIEQVHELECDPKSGIGNCMLSARYDPFKVSTLKGLSKWREGFITGDPFFLDSLFQSMQLVVAQDSCLPIAIGRLELSVFGDEESHAEVVTANVTRIEGGIYRGDAEAGLGSAFARMTNCRLKILGTKVDGPSANDLVDSTGRDEMIIRGATTNILRELGVRAPIFKCKVSSAFRMADRSERHQLELPVMKSALEEFLSWNRSGIKNGNYEVTWSERGKPVVRGAGLEQVGVSLSHVDRTLVCIAGVGAQGCDIESIQQRDVGGWHALLGHKYGELLSDRPSDVYDLNSWGTALWCAVESAKKAGNVEPNLERGRIGNGWVALRVVGTDNGLIITLPLKLTKLTSGILAFYIESTSLVDIAKPTSTGPDKASLLKTFGFDEDAFGVNVDLSGPQGQYVFSKRFPVTFRTNKLLSRRVYFTTYFDWMGELREHSIQPIMTSLAKMFESGGWGLATNWVKLQILGELRGSDIVTGRVWMEETELRNESIFDICFEWRKDSKSNMDSERVAFCRQRVSWIEITGHGQGRVGQLPEPIKAFMDGMRPRMVAVQPLAKLKEPIRELSLGGMRKDMTVATPLIQRVVDTTLENSNLVGNVYFSNYAKWLGAAGDLYFYRSIPEHYRANAKLGEFICVSCDINHAREAMPFDRIATHLFLEKVHDNGLDLKCEFHLEQNGEMAGRLAVARQRLIWVQRDGELIKATAIPAELIEKLIVKSPRGAAVAG